MRLRWSRGSVLAFGTQVQTRPKPSDFSGRKNPQRAFFRKGSKAVCPMSHICGTKKNPKVYAWKSQFSVEITGHFSPKQFPLSLLGSLVERLKDLQLSISCTRLIQSKPSHLIYLRSILILRSHLPPDFPSGLLL